MPVGLQCGLIGPSSSGGGGGDIPTVVTPPNEFQLYLENPTDGTRPGATGVLVTPGASNVMGAWTQLIDGSTAWPVDSGDGYELELEFFDSAVAAQARDMLVTIGIDLAGGTSYTDFIVHLSAAGAPIVSVGSVPYVFPVKIPRGASLAAKAQVNNATAGGVRVWVRIACKPTRPDLLWTGTFVRTFGADTATSAGVAITPGAAADGSWVEIGTAADQLYYVEYGIGTNNAVMTATMLHVDVAAGNATTKRTIVPNARVITTTAETISKGDCGRRAAIAVAEKFYVRAQAGGSTASTGTTALVYGVG